VFDANCPNCGAAVRFRSADLPVKVCDYCRSSLVRTGDVLQAMGKIAEVPEDVSPLQIGVRGTDGGVGFELIGRVRWRWTDGGWNEWLALFDDGSTAWIGEAMGRYMLLRPVEHGGMRTGVVRSLRDDQDIELGTEATIDGINYTVTDVKEASCAGGDGELPFSTPAGLTMKSIDLMAPDGHCASIQKERGEVLVYAGRYVTLGDLKATGLRAFEGWPMPRFAA
jgi:hypothetical protein